MFCGKCGVKLQDGAKFCHNCGAKIENATNEIALNNDNSKLEKNQFEKLNKIISDEIDNNTISPQSKKNRIEEGAVITFGKYNNDSIKWRVLKVVPTKRKALILSEKVLFLSTYGNSNREYANMDEEHRLLFDLFGRSNVKDVVWANSRVRSLLNIDFYNKAFNENEKSEILKSNIDTIGKKSNNTYGGNDTNDKIFLLSIDEFNKFMYCGKDSIGLYKGKKCSWWLRSPGISNKSVASIDVNGLIFMEKYHFNELGVRPAMYIKI